MPCGFTSGARLAPKTDRKLLVAAYCSREGQGRGGWGGSRAA